MVGGLNAEAEEFIPAAAAAAAAVVPIAAVSATTGNAAGGDRRQSGRNPRRAGRGEAGSTNQHGRKSTGRRANPSNGGRGVNPAHNQRQKRSTADRGDGHHPAHSREVAGGVESVSLSLAQHGGRLGNSRWAKNVAHDVASGRVRAYSS